MPRPITLLPVSLPHHYMHSHDCNSQLLVEVSIKECDADYAFAEEDDIMSKNRYKGLCPCMHLHTKSHHTQHTAQHTTQHSTPHSSHTTPNNTQSTIHTTYTLHTYIRTYTVELGLFHSFACPLPLVKRSTVHSSKG